MMMKPGNSQKPLNFSRLCMDGTLSKYNQFMTIVGSSDERIEEAPMAKSQKLLYELDEDWSYMRGS